MKKFFTLFAAATMMLAASAEALTVYDGNGYDYYVPINSLWFDEGDVRTQVLYPAADLTELVGKKITAMTFYTDNYGCYMNGGLMNISMGETDVNVLTDYIEGLTQVGTATMTRHTGEAVEITINFTTPYEYQGGNLVFDNVIAQPGDYGMTYFMGVKPDYDNALTYSYGSVSARRFLPMTTFTYEAGSVTPDDPVVPTEACAKPEGGYVNGTDFHGVLVTLINNETAEGTELHYTVTLNGEVIIEDAIYDDAFALTQDGDYVIDFWATAPGKLDSTHGGLIFTVDPTTGLSEMNADKAVAGVRYFNMAGQEMQQAQGLTIVLTTYTDGTTSAVKVIK